MAYDEDLAVRIRAVLGRRAGVSEKRMFGGLGFLLYGNMLVGVWKNSLIARLGEDQAQQVGDLPHVRPMDITGKPLKGWVLIEPDGLNNEAAVRKWVERAWKFVATLPGK